MTAPKPLTVEEIEAIEAGAQLYSDKVDRLCAAARRGIEARQEVADATADAYKCMILSSDLQARAEKAEAALAKAVRREIALAEECADAWRAAVDWSEYAGDYFKGKWNAAGDLAKCLAAEERLEAIRARNDQPSAQVASPAAQRTKGKSNIALKPCPFCGGKARFGIVCSAKYAAKEEPSVENEGAEYIECTNNHCRVSSMLIFPTMTDVKPLLAEKWNRREP